MTCTTAQNLAFLHVSGEWLYPSPDVEQIQINVKFCAAVHHANNSVYTSETRGVYYKKDTVIHY